MPRDVRLPAVSVIFGVDAIHVPRIILFSADFRIDSTLEYLSLPYFSSIVNTEQ